MDDLIQYQILIELCLEIPKPDLGQIIDAGEQVELTLRQWLRFALVQAYRYAFPLFLEYF